MGEHEELDVEMMAALEAVPVQQNGTGQMSRERRGCRRRRHQFKLAYDPDITLPRDAMKEGMEDIKQFTRLPDYTIQVSIAIGRRLLPRQ